MEAALAAIAMLLLFSLFITACAGTKEAEKAVQPEVEIPPYESISSLLVAGKPEEALEAFEKAYANDPDSFETALLRSGLLVSIGKTDEAKEALKTALEKEPDNPDALFTGALIAGLDGERNQEKALLESVVEKAPDHGRALAALGELYMEDKEYDKAEDSFEKVSKRNRIISLHGQATETCY